MDRPRFEHRPAGHPASVERLSLTEGSIEWPGVRTGHYDLAVAKHDHRVQCLAETSSTRDDRVEHCLDVGRRVRDDAQYFGGRRLLLQRLGEFLFQIGTGFAVVASARSRLRCLRTKTGDGCSALRPFASHDHLVGTVDRPMLVAPS
jgi:hypothetical protein